MGLNYKILKGVTRFLRMTIARWEYLTRGNSQWSCQGVVQGVVQGLVQCG